MDESETITVEPTMPKAVVDMLKSACLQDCLPLDDLLIDVFVRAAFGIRCDVLRCVTNVGR